MQIEQTPSSLVNWCLRNRFISASVNPSEFEDEFSVEELSIKS